MAHRLRCSSSRYRPLRCPLTRTGRPFEGSRHSFSPVTANGLRVTKVQFVLSGHGYHRAVLGTAVYTRSGIALLWNTTTVPNGSYQLESVATNKAGVQGYSAPITIKVDN